MDAHRDNQLRRPVVGWVFYDWASSAFSTTVMAGFFPIFFKQYWCAGVDPSVSTFRLGAANSIASLTVALLAPLLGAVADAGGCRRRFLLFLAGVGATMTVTLTFVPQEYWLAAAGVYLAAVIGFSGANVFYDSLLVNVAPPGRTDSISATGFAVGYLGGGLLFALNVAMSRWPSVFGLSDATVAVRLSFVTVALWWAAFSVPLALWVREREPDQAHKPSSPGTSVGLRSVLDTIRHIRQYRVVVMFLVAYWLYIDGVHTIVRMAVDYGLSIGFGTNDLIAALLLVQFVGFPASLAFGAIARRTGARTAILGGLVVYVLITVWGARMQEAWEFYVLAGAIGLVQGGVTSLSRSMYASMIPKEHAAQFYGFYNAVGRFSAVIGPVLMGWVGLVTGSPRASILSIALLIIAGAAILMRIPAGSKQR